MKRKSFLGLLILAFILASILFPLFLYSYEKRLDRPQYPIIDTVSRWSTTLDEYDTYCKCATLPQKFVSYTQIQSLGEFCQFVDWYPNLPIFYSVQYYLMDSAGALVNLILRDANDRFLQVTFGHDYPIYKTHNSQMLNKALGVPDKDNMMTLPKEAGLERFAYIRCTNDIWYQYYNGKLFRVFWIYNDIVFSFESDSSNMALDFFHDYPDMDADTFTVKLLNVETAEQAIEELMRECFPDQEYTGLQRIKVPKFKN